MLSCIFKVIKKKKMEIMDAANMRIVKKLLLILILFSRFLKKILLLLLQPKYMFLFLFFQNDIIHKILIRMKQL